MAFATLAPLVSKALPAWSFLQEASLLDYAWREVGGRLADYTQIVALDQKRLILETTYAPVVQEIKFRRQELLKRLNAYFSTPWLVDLQVRLPRP